MQNSISYWQHFLLQETEEKELSPKQRKIAKLDPPADEIDAGDFAALRAGAKIEEKVDMDELEFELKRLKKENPGKKITYDFIQDSPKGYVFYIDGKLVKKDKTDDAIDRSELNMLKKLTPTKEIKAKIDALKAKLGVNENHEGQDHEVSMANNSLETIIKHAMDLKSKLGSEEKDIPAWIQDHITNAANFISQAAENYHEYGEDHDDAADGGEEKTDDEIENASLEDLLEKIIKTKK